MDRKMELADLLEQYSKFHAPSGQERGFAEFLQKLITPIADNCNIDSAGNVIARIKGNDDARIMITSHMDEVGFMVTYIDEGGFVYFNKIGGVNPSILPGTLLYLHHDGKQIPAVVGIPSYRKENSSGEFSYGDLWLDAGFKDREDAMSMITVGDYITFRGAFQTLQNQIIAYQSADNKVGVVIACLLLSRLSKASQRPTVDFVFSTGEEIGLVGSKYAMSKLNPTECIVIDAAHATDYPTTNHKLRGEIRLNNGIVLAQGAEVDEQIVKELKKVSNNLGKRYQTEPVPGNSMTEAHDIKISNNGLPTAIVSFPCRYMHSNYEIVGLNDIQDIVDILYNYCVSKYI